MKKLKIQFILFTLFLMLILGFFVSKAFQQIRDQEIQSWQNISESVYNQFQARISDFLIQEDNKNFQDYQFNSQKSILSFDHRQKGFLGYFQINPDGEFRSQFLAAVEANPKSQSIQLQNEKLEQKHESLKNLTANLFDNRSSGVQKILEQKPKSYVQLNSAPVTDKLSFGYEKTSDDFSSSTKNKEGRAKTFQDSLSTLSESVQSEEKTNPKKVSPYSSKSNFYPNPLLRKKSRKYSQKSYAQKNNLTPKLGKTETTGESFADTQSEKDFDIENWISQERTLDLNNVTDPFQARLISNKYILFYRNAWFKKQVYQQGFILDAKVFFSWLLRQSYEDTTLPDFTRASIELNSSSGLGNLISKGARFTKLPKTLFQRQLGYPLSLLKFRIDYNHLPQTSAQSFLLILTIGVFFILLLSLYLIFRSTATQITLAEKKEDFVSAVTHELKTPLTSIRLSSELLDQGWLSETGQVKQHYKMLLKESERLSRLIENVLSLSRLEKKKYKLHLKTDSPSQDLVEFSKEFENLVKQEGFTWELILPESLPEIEYDADALKQILFNLIENSLKFSKNSTHKKIILEAALHASELEISIRDFGPGIPEKMIDHIFNKFYRVENELTRKTKGTGIGLSLVKTFMEQMHAKIRAENHSQQGLTIRLFFPVKHSKS